MDLEDKDLMRPILHRIFQARQYRGKHQYHVAEAVGLPRPSYTLIESGDQRLTVATLLRIADYLCMPLDWILTGYALIQGQRRKYDSLWQIPELPAMPRPGLVSSSGGFPGLPAFTASPATTPTPAASPATRPTPTASPATRPTPATSPATRSSSKRPAKKGTARKQPPAKAAARWKAIRKGQK